MTLYFYLDAISNYFHDYKIIENNIEMKVLASTKMNHTVALEIIYSS